ncbi:MAG: hypothetical protein K8M05_26695 [Deltaproteobacteria bacterium]|nr:hypothetical protein [Kofleriaceae bacterium]
MRGLLLAALALLVAACYSPTYEGLVCGAGSDPCPDGYACVTNVCVEDRGECGDGVRSGAEACDDMNNVTETMCPYGLGTCTLCNADCTQELSLVGRFCGDRMVEPGVEACDDGNGMACGSCNADCTMALVPTAATGELVGVAMLTSANEGQSFGLFDGVLPDYRGFELDYNGAVQPQFVRVDMTSGSPVSAVVQAINSSNVSITATDIGNGNVRLVNQLLNGRGNGPIMTNIPPPFAVMGMSGGAGGDCPTGTGCTSNGVCSSNSCVASVCQ